MIQVFNVLKANSLSFALKVVFLFHIFMDLTIKIIKIKFEPKIRFYPSINLSFF